MTLSIILPALVAVLGALAYAITQNAKVAELGRLAYACGLLVTLFVVAQHVARLP